jgi:hypothetical protein
VGSWVSFFLFSWLYLLQNLSSSIVSSSSTSYIKCILLGSTLSAFTYLMHISVSCPKLYFTLRMTPLMTVVKASNNVTMVQIGHSHLSYEPGCFYVLNLPERSSSPSFSAFNLLAGKDRILLPGTLMTACYIYIEETMEKN